MGKCRTFISRFVHSNPLILITGLLLAGHTVAFYQMYTDSVGFDILLSLSDTLAHSTIFVLDLQFLYLVMVLCKRYRTMNKILTHITRVSTSDGSGSKFFGFGLRFGSSFRVRVHRVLLSKYFSGIFGFGFGAKISFRVRVWTLRVLGFSGFMKIRFLPHFVEKNCMHTYFFIIAITKYSSNQREIL